MRLWFLRFMGFCLILFFLYLRLRTRIPHELEFRFSVSYVIIVIIILVIYGFSLKQMFFPSVITENFLTKILAKITKNIYNSLHLVFVIFYDNLIGYNSLTLFPIFDGITNTFLKKLNYVYFFSYVFAPLVFSVSLFVDIVCYNYMFYFYKVIGVIWVPIILRIILYIINYWGEIFKTQLNQIFTVKVTWIFLENGRYPDIKLTLKKDQAINMLYPDFLYVLLYTVVETNNMIQIALSLTKNEKWAKILHTIIYSLNIMTWSYVLYKLGLNLIKIISTL